VMVAAHVSLRIIKSVMEKNDESGGDSEHGYVGDDE
jgi:hypothetical protein